MGEALFITCHGHNSLFEEDSSDSIWVKKGKSNLDYLKVWAGCVVFYRVMDAKKTKLGPRAINRQ